MQGKGLQKLVAKITKNLFKPKKELEALHFTTKELVPTLHT